MNSRRKDLEAIFTWGQHLTWLYVLAGGIASASTAYIQGWPLPFVIATAFVLPLILWIGLEGARLLSAKRRMALAFDEADLTARRKLLDDCREVAAAFDPTAGESVRDYLKSQPAFAKARAYMGEGFMKLFRSRSTYIDLGSSDYDPIIAAFLTEIDHLEYEWGFSKVLPRERRAVGPSEDRPRADVVITGMPHKR